MKPNASIESAVSRDNAPTATNKNTEAIQATTTQDTLSTGKKEVSERNKASEKNTGKSTTEETPFEKLFTDLLKDTYWAEKHLVASIPAMVSAASTESLKEAFEDHLHLTKKHVQRLERIFSLLNKPAAAEKCPVMEALVKEAKRVIDATPERSMTRDAGLIISAQKIEHYEIAAYGSMVQVALTLQYDEVASILEKTLNDEEEADRFLTAIAESDVNPMADDEDQEANNTVYAQADEYDGEES